MEACLKVFHNEKNFVMKRCCTSGTHAYYLQLTNLVFVVQQKTALALVLLLATHITKDILFEKVDLYFVLVATVDIVSAFRNARIRGR